MAKFVKQSSDIAVALNNLQQTAENFINAKTNRSIQLGREKQGRVAEAYQILINNENSQINELNQALNNIENSLLDKGVQLKGIGEEFQTIDAESLLKAAAEGSMSLLQNTLEQRKKHKESLQGKKVNATAVKRQIDMFDNALAAVNPADLGDDGLWDVEDIVKHEKAFTDSLSDVLTPEFGQRIEALKTEEYLSKLNTSYFANLTDQTNQKIASTKYQTAAAGTKIRILEDAKKEPAEGVKALLSTPVNNLAQLFTGAIQNEATIESGEDEAGNTLNDTEVQALKDSNVQMYDQYGAVLFPWSETQEQANIRAQGLKSALIRAGSGNYEDLVRYLKEGHTQYMSLLSNNDPNADLYKEDVRQYLGVDISNKSYIEDLQDLLLATNQAEIEQAMEALKTAKRYLPEETFEEDTQDLNDFLSREF